MSDPQTTKEALDLARALRTVTAINGKQVIGDMLDVFEKAIKENAHQHISGAAKRAELAGKIAKSLMFFPLQPRKEDEVDEYYKCLELSFTLRITQMLNEAANATTGI